MCRVSIIIPIYKVEAYLAECLESVRRQTMPDFEVIMVDDGSPDNSAAICREFEKMDARFRLLQQENSGVTAARRAGVACAVGEFIAFVDGDDTLPPDALGILLSHMSDDVDIVVGQAREFSHETLLQSISIDEYRRKLICVDMNLALWAILFRRCIFSAFTFDVTREVVTGEDWIVNLRLAFNTEKDVNIIPETVYHYRVREGSLVRTMKWTMEHEILVFEGLCASVPVAMNERYLPMLAATYASIWVRLTKRMVRLSPAAGELRQRIVSLLEKDGEKLRLQDKLFLQYTKPLGRMILIILSKINGLIHRVISRIYVK